MAKSLNFAEVPSFAPDLRFAYPRRDAIVLVQRNFDNSDSPILFSS